MKGWITNTMNLLEPGILSIKKVRWVRLDLEVKQRIWCNVLARYGVPFPLLAFSTKCCRQLQIASREYDLSKITLGHSSLQRLLCQSAHFWKVRSAHPVLLAVFAGMLPLEAFCTSSRLSQIALMVTKRLSLLVYPMTAAFSLQEYLFQQQNHSSHSSKSVILKQNESSQHTSWNHPSRSTRSWMHSSNSSTFWRHIAWQCFCGFALACNDDVIWG